MATRVASYQELVDFLCSQGLSSEEAVPLSETFMGALDVDFDADGNFAPMDIVFDQGARKLSRG